MKDIAEQAVDVLNRALKSDPDAVGKLMGFRVACNETLADDPTIQILSENGRFTVSTLGIINGILGTRKTDSWGMVTGVWSSACPECGDTDTKVGNPCPACGTTIVWRLDHFRLTSDDDVKESSVE